MSKNVGIPLNFRKRFLKILLVVFALLALSLVYGAGSVVLPLSIFGMFQNKNCDRALAWHKVYTRLYPEFMEDNTLLDQVRECEAYASAVSREKNGNWREAYEAYQLYTSTHPNGLYAGEAHEHSGLLLAQILKEQVAQKNYEQALTHLNLLVSDYYDTSVSAETWTLGAAMYTSWSRDLRAARDFEGSERVLNDFKTWSQKYQQTGLAMDAQRELVQTYLAWGLDLQSQKQFENALVKFDLARGADPQSQFDSAAEVKASPGKLYVAWGNDLLEQKQFPAAVEKFEQAVSRAEAGQDGEAKDALANGHIRWASSLSSTDDFQGALEHLKLAGEAASSEAMKKSVQAALQDTYLAFSKSTGEQARRAMRDVLKTVCDRHKAPELPIFGLDQDSIRFAIYGVEDKLPENLTARTPGEMHYIVCIKTDNRTVQSREHHEMILKVRGGYYFTRVRQYRVQIVWNVTLRRTDTSESAGEETFIGAEPPPFSEVGGNYFFGETPMDEFLLWLQSFQE